MKKVIIVIVIVGVVLLVSSGSANEPEVTTIGVMAPLSGPAAAIGEWVLEGVGIALAEINADGERIRLIVEDSGCNGPKATSAYTKLRNVDTVDYIVGPLCAAASVPVSDLARDDSVVIVRTGLTSSNLTDVGGHLYNILPKVAAVAHEAVRFAIDELDVERVSILYSTDEYGFDNEASIVEYVADRGIEVISSEGYDKTTSDVRTQILKIKSDDSDAVILAGYAPGYSAFIKQAREQELDKHIVAVSNLQNPSVLDAVGDLGMTVYYPYPVVSDLDSVEEFAAKYRSTYGSSDTFLPMYIGSGYDGLHLLASALSKCGDEVTCVQESLVTIKDYIGANGPITFDAGGNNTNDAALEMRVLRDGAFAIVK